MSKEAWCKKKDGSEEKIHIDNVSDELISDPELLGFFCVGICEKSKEPCRVEMTPVRNGPRTGFRVKRGCHHGERCNKDESGPAKIKRRLDKLGRITNIEELLQNIMNPKQKEKKCKKGKGNNIGGEEIQKNGEEYIDDRPIKRGLKKPKKLKVLCEIFSKCEPDEMFANKRVGNIYIGRASIVDVRKKGLSEGQTAIVICCRIGKARREKIAPNAEEQDIVLQDAYAFADGVSRPDDK